MTKVVTHDDWPIFFKNPLGAKMMALMTARAHTGRNTVLLAKSVCHGAAPWRMPCPGGTTLKDHANKNFFDYSEVASLQEVAGTAGGELTAIFASPFCHDAFVNQGLPNRKFARRARELCDKSGALLMVDDIRADLRLTRNCSSVLISLNSHLLTWGRSMARIWKNKVCLQLTSPGEPSAWGARTFCE